MQQPSMRSATIRNIPTVRRSVFSFTFFGAAAFVAMLATGCGGGGGGDNGSGGGGSGAKCSNILGQQCGAGEFCNFTDGTCGETGTEGVCQPLTVTACTGPAISQAAPVCACTGITFDNDCWAGAAGQSVRAPGICP